MRRRSGRESVSPEACRALIAAAANLSMAGQIAWKVDDDLGASSTGDLADDLLRCRNEGRQFLLPSDARGWFELDFAYPDASYSLALMYLWAIGAVSPQERERSGAQATKVLEWYLARALPPHAREAVSAVTRALSSLS
jgi:hypothetical protein